jgi:hypothetical protein
VPSTSLVQAVVVEQQPSELVPAPQVQPLVLLRARSTPRVQRQAAPHWEQPNQPAALQAPHSHRR